MNFLDHTIGWAKGEAFEMTLLAVVGAVLLLGAGLLWKAASTPAGQALPLPVSIVAVIFIVAGVVGILGTPDKIAQFEHDYEQSPANFVYQEKIRVQAFDTIYTYTRIGAAIAFAIALVMFSLSENTTLRAVAVALIMIGFSGLVIDMFSEERANNYLQAIEAEILRLKKIDE